MYISCIQTRSHNIVIVIVHFSLKSCLKKIWNRTPLLTQLYHFYEESYNNCSEVLGIYLWAALWSQWFILLDILFANSVKEL